MLPYLLVNIRWLQTHCLSGYQSHLSTKPQLRVSLLRRIIRPALPIGSQPGQAGRYRFTTRDAHVGKQLVRWTGSRALHFRIGKLITNSMSVPCRPTSETDEWSIIIMFQECEFYWYLWHKRLAQEFSKHSLLDPFILRFFVNCLHQRLVAGSSILKLYI